jgi:general secretion pathway protein A
LNASGSALGIRLSLADHLTTQTAESRRWLAVVDEAHGLSNEQLEELRLLTNRLGETDGFAGMILVGQTRLARRLATQELAALEARLTARVHLRSIDADEAQALLEHENPARAWSVAEAEALHRDAFGNPSRLLRLASERTALPARHVRWLGEGAQRPGGPILQLRPNPAARLDIEPETTISAAHEPDSVRSAPLLGPTRPPLIEEEGLIEVGWEPAESVEAPVDAGDEAAEAPGPAAEPSAQATAAEPSEEALRDHYAALQAWNEWARNQGRRPSGARDDDECVALDDRPEEELRADGLNPSPGHVWAEGPDSFAPYSQLFSRLRPSKDPD